MGRSTGQSSWLCGLQLESPIAADDLQSHILAFESELCVCNSTKDFIAYDSILTAEWMSECSVDLWLIRVWSDGSSRIDIYSRAFSIPYTKILLSKPWNIFGMRQFKNSRAGLNNYLGALCNYKKCDGSRKRSRNAHLEFLRHT